MADLADHAYAHAVATLGDGEPALEAALVAVRRGGRSRVAVLGHARSESLLRAGAPAGAALDGPAPDDLTDLALALASTRPALERTIVDLELRHGLDRTAFARALGTSTAAAATRASEVAATWAQALDPVVLARLGAGGCAGLAAALGERVADESPGGAGEVAVAVADGGVDAEGDPGSREPEDAAVVAPSLRELLALRPAVLDHAAECSTCADRLRSMVTVRTLLGQRPLEPAPAPVRAAAAPSRLRRPAPVPPLQPAPASRRWMRPVAIVATAVAVALAGGATVAALRSDGDPDETIEALTRVPAAGSGLAVSPATVEGRVPPAVRLENRSGEAIDWVAAPGATWLRVVPAEGRLAAGESAPLRLSVGADAPEGDLRASVQITGRDGSAAVVRLAVSIEHPPDVAATATGCDVVAMVEDEGEVEAVALHWFEAPATPGGRPTERIERLAPAAAGYAGRLPDAASPTTWWVAAADARGNTARTADQVLPPSSCPS